MLILAVETSCDETSIAVVEDGRCVRSNIVASQITLHAPFGGVVPEIASRQHVRVISWILREALKEAQVALGDVDAVAATQGPGLAGALLVGMNFGRGLALGLSKPFVPVNHLEGHLHSVWLSRNQPLLKEPDLPMLALVVSGGHTELVVVKEHGEYDVVGRTLDDAAGEAFDKVARLLGLSYPGGPAIQACAAEASAPCSVSRAWLSHSFDFSFSGVKTAVLHLAYEMAENKSPHDFRGQRLPDVNFAEALSREQIANLAAGFQESVVDVLVTKTTQAADTFPVQSVALVGGVAANQALRKSLGEHINLPLYIPDLEFSTDNAAMIASAAYYSKSRQGPTADIDVLPALSLTLEERPIR